MVSIVSKLFNNKSIKIIHFALFLMVLFVYGVFGAMPDGSKVSRVFSDVNVTCSEEINVTLNVTINGTWTYYLIEEDIPSTWTVLDSGGGNTSNLTILKWAYYNKTVQAPDVSYIYTVRASGVNGNYTFSGIYQIENMSSSETIEGSTLVSVSGCVAPFCGDGVCNNGEGCSTCASDCGTCPPGSSSSSSSSSSGGGGGGGGSGNYIPPSNDVCDSDYECGAWSLCQEGYQYRFCSDLNNCSSEKIKKVQTCIEGNSQFDNDMMNAKQLEVEKVDDKKYKSSFEGTEDLVYFNSDDTPEALILYNEFNQKEYFALAVEEKNGKKVYSIKKIDAEVLESGILQQYGLVDEPITTKFIASFDSLYNNRLVQTLSTTLFIFIMIGCIFVAHFIIKRTHRKKAYGAILSSKNGKEYLDSRYSSEEVQELEKSVNELKSYVKRRRNEGVTDDDLKKELLQVGWNVDIVNQVMSYAGNSSNK